MTRTDESPAGVVTTRASGDDLVLAAGGEFDRHNSHLLFTAVRRAVAAGCHTITLDLSRVTFLDASTVRILLDCAEITARSGHALRIVRPDGVPGMVLDAGVAWARRTGRRR